MSSSSRRTCNSARSDPVPPRPVPAKCSILSPSGSSRSLSRTQDSNLAHSAAHCAQPSSGGGSSSISALRRASLSRRRASPVARAHFRRARGGRAISEALSIDANCLGQRRAISSASRSCEMRVNLMGRDGTGRGGEGSGGERTPIEIMSVLRISSKRKFLIYISA